MAFNNLQRFGVDASDMALWERSGVAMALREEIREQQRLAFVRLRKGGEKNHSEHMGVYNAYDKVLSIIDGAAKLK